MDAYNSVNEIDAQNELVLSHWIEQCCSEKCANLKSLIFNFIQFAKFLMHWNECLLTKKKTFFYFNRNESNWREWMYGGPWIDRINFMHKISDEAYKLPTEISIIKFKSLKSLKIKMLKLIATYLWRFKSFAIFYSSNILRFTHLEYSFHIVLQYSFPFDKNEKKVDKSTGFLYIIFNTLIFFNWNLKKHSEFNWLEEK